MRLRLLAVLLPLVPAPLAAAEPIAGRWLTVEKDSIVEIAPCGARMCGRIARILRPVEGPAIDRNNPDPALRRRPLVGLPILLGFTDRGSSWGGQIYDPRRGKLYRSVLARNPDGALKVQGCIAFFCQTQVWTRAQ